MSRSALTAHTARKAHTCDWCWQTSRRLFTIRPGHRYLRHVAFPDSEVNQGPVPVVHRECIQCAGQHDESSPRLTAGACASYCHGVEPCALPFTKGAPSHGGADHQCHRCTAAEADAEAAAFRAQTAAAVDQLLAEAPA